MIDAAAALTVGVLFSSGGLSFMFASLNRKVSAFSNKPSDQANRFFALGAGQGILVAWGVWLLTRFSVNDIADATSGQWSMGLEGGPIVMIFALGIILSTALTFMSPLISAVLATMIYRMPVDQQTTVLA